MSAAMTSVVILGFGGVANATPTATDEAAFGSRVASSPGSGPRDITIQNVRFGALSALDQGFATQVAPSYSDALAELAPRTVVSTVAVAPAPQPELDPIPPVEPPTPVRTTSGTSRTGTLQDDSSAQADGGVAAEALDGSAGGSGASRTSSVQDIEPLVAAPAPPITADFTSNVAVAGGQAEIDRCAGPVLFAGSVIAEHNHCGGAWMLNVNVGNTVQLSGLVSGLYQAVSVRVLPKGSTTADLAGMGGSGIYLQTCTFKTNQLRLVALAKIG